MSRRKEAQSALSLLPEKNTEEITADAYADLEIEQQLLRYAMVVDAGVLAHLEESVFYGDDERLLFRELKSLNTVLPENSASKILSKRMDSTLYNEIAGTVRRVLQASKITNPKVAQELIKVLQRLWLQRTIIEQSTQAIELASSGDTAAALKSVHTIMRTDMRQRVESGEYVADYAERASIIQANAQKTGADSILIPTGIVRFDSVTGGLKKGEVGVVVGRTGGGKSVAKLNFAVHAYLLGFNVLHIGLEMTRHENEFRADSILTEIPATCFRFARLSEHDQQQWRTVMTNLRKQYRNYLEFVGAKSLTMSEILALAEGVENKHGRGIDLLILDHIVLVKGDRTIRDFHLQQWDTMERLTEYAVTQNKAVWTSSQSTDEGISRKKGMRVIDVKYSRAIAELSNILVALYQSEIDEASGDLNFAVRKGRGVKSGLEIVLKPDFDRLILDTRSFVEHRLNLLNKLRGGDEGAQKKGTSKPKPKKLGQGSL